MEREGGTLVNDDIKRSLEHALTAIRETYGKRILLIAATALVDDNELVVVGATYGDTNDEKLEPIADIFAHAARVTRKNIGRKT